MSQQPERESIMSLLGLICRAQRSQLNAGLGEIGIYAGQEVVLWELSRQDGLYQSQLVERMCVQPPTVSKMLDRMEIVGLVRRSPDTEDSRISRVYLTEQGRNNLHLNAPGWAEGRWKSMENYFGAKAAIQDRVHEAGFAHWTLLKPAAFMENFLPGSFMMPRGVRGGLVTCVKPNTELALIAVDDIGVAAAAAFADPARFDGVELELAGERLSMTQIAEVLSRALGVELTAPDMTPEQAIAAGASPFAVQNDWQNEIGHPARPEFARALGIPLTSFADWAQAHLKA
jgi:DNA-binding MarR family transcriptional regulator